MTERQFSAPLERTDSAPAAGDGSASRLAAARAQANRTAEIGSSAIDRVLSVNSQLFLQQTVNNGGQ